MVNFLYMDTKAYPVIDEAEWITDKRQLYDYPSGVIVAELTYPSNGYI